MGIALVLFAVLAVADWVVVWRGGPHSMRWLTKPAPMVLLLVAALSADVTDGVQAWIVAGLVLSLLGDVLLLLPEQWFVGGLAAFLLAHLAYIAGMSTLVEVGWLLLLTPIVLAVAWHQLGHRIVNGAAEREPKMRWPVLAYVSVISLMVWTAAATGQAWLIVAAVLFYISDATLGYERFVASKAWMKLAVMVTYHLAQFSFVVFLVQR